MAALPWLRAPVLDLAMNSTQIRTRLASIPVYTVANSKDEFVLVSDDKGESASGQNQLGLFFLCEADAKALIARIGQQDDAMAKDARVQTVSMDMVMEVFSRDPAEGLQNVAFRFMPDQRQVKAAMELFAREGVPVKQLPGIPVFQAEGLTISSDNTEYVPIFFAKEDLDVALGTAHNKRSKGQAAQLLERAEALTREYEEAKQEYASSTDNKVKRRAKERADKALANAEKTREKAAKVGSAGMPRIEVGCLEDVICQMERDTKGEWESVLFIPPGAIVKANEQLKKEE